MVSELAGVLSYLRGADGRASGAYNDRIVAQLYITKNHCSGPLSQKRPYAYAALCNVMPGSSARQSAAAPPAAELPLR